MAALWSTSSSASSPRDTLQSSTSSSLRTSDEVAAIMARSKAALGRVSPSPPTPPTPAMPAAAAPDGAAAAAPAIAGGSALDEVQGRQQRTEDTLKEALDRCACRGSPRR